MVYKYIYIQIMSLKNKKIFIAGHNGMVGSSLFEYLKKVLKKSLQKVEKIRLNKFLSSK